MCACVCVCVSECVWHVCVYVCVCMCVEAKGLSNQMGLFQSLPGLLLEYSRVQGDAGSLRKRASGRHNSSSGIDKIRGNSANSPIFKSVMFEMMPLSIKAQLCTHSECSTERSKNEFVY